MAGSDEGGSRAKEGARVQRGVRTTLAMAKERLARGDARSAEALCREAHGEHGSDAELLATLGRALTEQGRFAEAAPFLAQAISLDRKNAGAHRDLGEALLHGGRAEVALVMLQRAFRLSDRPLPGLDALIQRARETTEREGLTVIVDPTDEAGERTLILRSTDPSLRALKTDPGEPEPDETQVLDGLPTFGASGAEPDLTDPAGLSLAARLEEEEEAPAPTAPDTPRALTEDEEKSVLYLGPAPGLGHRRQRPAPEAAPPVLEGEPDLPLLGAQAAAEAKPAPGLPHFEFSELSDGSEDDAAAGEVLAGLAAAMPEAHARGGGQLDVGVDDVLNAVLGGRLLAGPGRGVTGRGRPDRRRLALGATLALLLGLGLGALVRLGDGGSGALPVEGSPGARLARDTRVELSRLADALAPSEDEADRLLRAQALALRLAHHGGTSEDAAAALGLLERLSPEAGGSPLALATLAELQAAEGRLSSELRERLARLTPRGATLIEALGRVAADPAGEQPPRARALAHRSLARLALARGDLPAAARELSATLALAPEDAGTHRSLLRLAGQAGAAREVSAALAALRRIDPSDLQAHADELLWYLARGEEELAAGRAALASALAAVNDPVLVGRTELVLAVASLREGELAEGGKHREAAGAHPEAAHLARLLGILAAGSGAAPDREAATITLALGRIVPTPGEVWPFRLESERLGALPGAGAPDTELDLLERRARELDLLTRLAASAGPGDTPGPEVQALAEGGPEDRLLAAHLHLRRGEHEAALAVLPAPRELPEGESSPAALASQLVRGLALERAGQPEAAEVALDALERAGHHSLPALEVLARLRLARGEAEGCLETLDTALIFAPRRRDLGLLRVVALHRTGRPDAATKAMSSLRALQGPPLAEAMDALPARERATLDLYLALSEPEPPPGEVEKLLRAALKADPELVDVHFHLGRLLARLDRKAPARRSIARYLKLAGEGFYAETARALQAELR
ncbi:MAG: tetratricopeptide repeat protein [Deltaproteobacteria bacterium]|nr:tetratricopeptide repeat protein [Deltaproteobacteria bacterium]